MQNLQTFAKNLLTMMGISVYDHFVVPEIQILIGNIQNIQNELNSLLPATNTLIEGLVESIVSEFDETLATTNSDAKVLLTWLLYASDNKEIQNTLVTVLEDAFQTLDKDFIQNFASAISDKKWLKSSEALPLTLSSTQDSNTLISLLTKALQTLVNDKVKEFVQKTCSFLQDQLEPTLLKFVQDNGGIVGDTIGTRFATLIQQTSPIPAPNTLTIWQQSYDNIVKLIANQIQSLVDASKKISSSADENALLAAFCEQNACDPAIRQMLNPPSGTDQATYQAEVEQSISLEAARRLLALLLPDQRQEQNGLTVTVPGIVLLLRQCTFPPKIVQVAQSILQWPEDLFPNGPPAPIDTLLSSANYFFEKALASIVMDQIQTGLAKGLNLGMNIVVPPEYLNMWMVQGAFPAIFPALVKAFVTIKLADVGDSLSKQFLPLAQGVDRQTVFSTLIPALYSDAQDMCKDVDFTTIGVTQDLFSEQITPLLNGITDYIAQQAPTKKHVDHDDVKHWIRTYTQPVDAGDNATYGQLLMDLIFHLGNLKALGNKDFAEFICKHFLQKTMSKGITSAFDPLRTSEELIVGGILQGLNKVMSTQDQVNQLLFGGGTPAIDVSQALQTDLNELGSIVDRLIRSLVDQLPNNVFENLGVDILKKLLPSEHDQQKAFTKVYMATLGNRYLNENLYIQVVDVILKALEDSATELQPGN